MSAEPTSGVWWQDYAAMMRAWRADPAEFWLEAARTLDWSRVPEMAMRVMPSGHAEWFPDGQMNICFNALDRHVMAGRGDCTALLWDSPAAEARATLSYADLLDRVARFAGGLQALDVRPGDRVMVSMPSLPEAVIAMLATARLGAIHVFVFGGFGAAEMAQRIDATQPKVLISASCLYTGRYLVRQAETIEAALSLSTNPPAACVVLQRPASPAKLVAGRDHDFETLAAASPVEAVPVLSTHPLYVLHTSGTTGRAKGVVRDHGGYATALALSMPVIYGVDPGDVFFTTSDLGWVVGHSYAVYGPLLAGCTSLLYEGAPVGTPDAGALWRLCAEHRVKVLLTAPTALRAIRQEDPEAALVAEHDLSLLGSIFVAGERSEPELLDWAARATAVGVFDHWWQTETGWPIAGTCRGFSGGHSVPGELPHVSPGFALDALDGAGRRVRCGESGELVLRLPLPPGCLRTLWDDDAGFRSAYLDSFPGYYRTYDLGTVDPVRGARLFSRTDDVLKIAGRRISGGLIEGVVAGHPEVAECAVVGVSDPLRGQLPVAFVVLHGAAVIVDETVLRIEFNKLLRARVGAFVRLRAVWRIDELPKTRSGKILRRMLAHEAAARLQSCQGAGRETRVA